MRPALVLHDVLLRRRQPLPPTTAGRSVVQPRLLCAPPTCQACVLFIHILLNRAVVGLGVNEAMAAVITAAAQRLYMGLEGWEPVALGTYAGSEVPEGDVIKYGEVRRVIQEALRRMDAAPAEAAALPQRLAAAGCRVASLTAKQLRAALHLRLYEAATAVQDLYVSTCARSGLPWPEGPPPMEEAAAAARALVRLQPGNAWWHLLEARVYLGNNQVGKAAPVLEAALAAAAQRKGAPEWGAELKLACLPARHLCVRLARHAPYRACCPAGRVFTFTTPRSAAHPAAAHYWHAQAASNMGLALMSGANGSCTYDVSRVRDHFAQAQDGRRLSKKWVAKDVLDEVKVGGEVRGAAGMHGSRCKTEAQLPSWCRQGTRE